MSDLSPKQLARLVTLAVSAVSEEIRETVANEVMRGVFQARERDAENWRELYSTAMRDLKSSERRVQALVEALTNERQACADLADEVEDCHHVPGVDCCAEFVSEKISTAILARGAGA